jgi:drug/metabolite transporter (DMT)-like permease
MCASPRPVTSPPHVNRFPPLILACLAATWFVWGSTYLAIKFSLASFPPFFGMGTRFIVAGIALLAWTWYRTRRAPTLLEWRNGIAVGTLMLAGNTGGVAYAEQWIASGLVVSFTAITPAMLALVSLPFGVRPARLEVLGVVLGFVGVLMLASGAGFSGSPAGLIAMIVAVITWSIGSVLSQHVLPLARGAAGFSTQLLGGGLSLLLLSTLTRETFHWPPEPLASAAWLYLVVFGSLIAFTAYMVLLSNTTTTLASSFTFVNPVIAMFLGISFGGDRISALEWFAVAVIVVGVTVVVLARGRRNASSPGPQRREDTKVTTVISAKKE